MTTALRHSRGWILVMATLVVLVWPSAAVAQLGALVSPGPLNKAHASIKGVTNCLQCHSKGQQVSAEKCLVCHKPVAARIAARKGIHRDVTTDCVTCHLEHVGSDADLLHFDQSQFEHTRDTGFALDGLHVPIAAKCESCHKTRSFLKAPTQCASCHNDPHKGSLGTSCESCHSVSETFVSASKGFDHSKTKFSLAGAHRTVTCESCHKNKRYTGLSFGACTSCHTDPHRPPLGPSCTSCHTESTWGTTKVDHARTAFPLIAKHATVACRKCHTTTKMTAPLRFDTCAACHDDPHRGTFKQDCRVCHTEARFTAGTFDHATTKFPLTDKHVGLTCVACHKTATPKTNDFRGLLTTCLSCHTDVHKGELGATCEQCHTARSFEVKTFLHRRPTPLFEGQHATLTCKQCHLNTMAPTRTGATAPLRIGYTVTPTACASCHKDVHLGQLSPRCDTCHTVATARFGVVGFSHTSTTFPLTGKHVPVACDKCHLVETGVFPSGPGTTRRFTGVATTCAGCHQDPHRRQLGDTCQTCHTTGTFAVQNYTHKNASRLRDFFVGRHRAASCADCHTPMPDVPAGAKPVPTYTVSTTCTACHTDVHRGALGTDCAACHKA